MSPSDDIPAEVRALLRVDTQVLTAASEMVAEQKAHPQWLWHDMEGGGVSYGRWSKVENAAPYIRADLVLTALAARTPDAGVLRAGIITILDKARDADKSYVAILNEMSAELRALSASTEPDAGVAEEAVNKAWRALQIEGYVLPLPMVRKALEAVSKPFIPYPEQPLPVAPNKGQTNV